MNATPAENQIESKPTTDAGASCSKKKRSNDSSSSEGGDYQHPLNHIETTKDSNADDEGDWEFWISYNQISF